MNDPTRDALARLVKERGETYAGLSQLLGRNPAYIQQFVKRGSPRRLEAQDRKTLARYFGVEDSVLGGEASVSFDRTIEIPRLSVQASAGIGHLVEAELAIGSFIFDKNWLRGFSRASPKDLSIIKVSGDSMSPSLNDGDDVLVDQSDKGPRIRDGIYVLRRDESLMVKRLALGPSLSVVTISSDNPSYPPFRDCPLNEITILGRVIWIGRRVN